MLFFSVMPPMDDTGANLREQDERLSPMKTARVVASAIAAENLIRRAIKSNVSPSASYKLKYREAVMVYSEKQQK